MTDAHEIIIDILSRRAPSESSVVLASRIRAALAETGLKVLAREPNNRQLMTLRALSGAGSQTREACKGIWYAIWDDAP